MFEVDIETMVPVKVHTYNLDLNDANPQWKHHHELTELYNMPDLSPRSFADLSERIFQDE
jgi:hypothetical protein